MKNQLQCSELLDCLDDKYPRKISVVLASYNGEYYIRDQIESWLRVLRQGDEIIISDDGSTDGTYRVINSIKDHRIVCILNDSRCGYQKNFERAIEKSSGKYIFFSDQDDICLPERVVESLQALQTHGCVFGDAIVTDDALRPTTDSYFASRRTKFFTAWSLFLWPTAIGATMACSKEFLSTALPFPRGVPHDQWLSVLAAARGELQVVRAPIILYRRHLGVASLTGLAKKRSLSLIAQERTRLLFALLLWFFKRALFATNYSINIDK